MCLVICFTSLSWKFWVISLVFITSKGQDTNPAMAAARDPPTEAETTGERPRGLVSRKYSKRGSWTAEKSISLARVVCKPV